MEFSQGIWHNKPFTPEDAEYSIRQLAAEVGQMVIEHIIKHGTMTVAVRTEIHENKSGSQMLQMHAIAHPQEEE